MSSLPLPLPSELKFPHLHDALFISLRLQSPGGDIAERNGCVSVTGTNAVCQCSHYCRDQHYLCLSFTNPFVRKICMIMPKYWSTLPHFLQPMLQRRYMLVTAYTLLSCMCILCDYSYMYCIDFKNMIVMYVLHSSYNSEKNS